jgi:solute carrier family 24 (sodium/potassium/calcium exchanger), member 6
MLYALTIGLVGLALVVTFSSPDKPPKWHKLRCVAGFIVAIAWISTIADEVVGILRAFGAILGVSEAILGVTVFAMVTMVVYRLTLGQFTVRFCGRCYRCEDGISHDGHVGMFRGPDVEYYLFLHEINIDILLGVGVSGLYINLTTEPEYQITMSPTLLVSTVSLFITLTSMLVIVPWMKWRMTRMFGICLVVFFTISTVISVLVEIIF